jgi:hypothetical protein
MPRKVSFGLALHGAELRRGTLKLNSTPPTTPLGFRAMSAERSGTVDSLADPIRVIVVSLMIYMVFGGQTPFILRRESEDRYILIGECYVNGVMIGEAMKEHLEGKYEKEVFHIY